ncbi:MAG: PKD domain-containing protein, partial [Chitinophagaceae bacterium]|nr:PKD domain-containing protein [Chitinophagaceae bacterium]
VSLTASSEFGCSNTITRDITINSTATTISSPDTVCLNTVVNFQNGSAPLPVSSVWDFGNAIQSDKLSDSTSYAAPGTYQVRLINTYAECVDSVFKNIVVRPRPTVDFTAANTIACQAPFSVAFQDLSPNSASWQWDFGDGNTSTSQNPVHNYTAEGQYNVTLTIVDRSGCTNSTTKSSFVRIVKPTVAVTNAPIGLCVGVAYSPIANINSLDGVASYFWDFGDGFTSTVLNPSHSYAATGNYTLRLIITTVGGCTDSVVYANNIRIGTTPNADFTASPLDVCPTDTVFFTTTSTASDQWSWNFGDGGTSGLENPSHVFSDTGSFNIVLIAYNNGCAQTVTKNLYVHVKPPIADFDIAVTCTNKRQVTFIDRSKVDAGYGLISYSWNFGDGSPTSNLQNPVHVYPAIGSYSVSLTVTNGSCSHLYQRTITLNTDTAGFTISKTTACKNEVISLTAVGSSPANIASYAWSFDGGAYIAATATTTHAFTTNGPHSIGLVITDINGCTDTIVRNAVIMIVGPTADFTAANTGGCANTTITFNDLSTPAGINQWRFDFGDAIIQNFTGAPFTHTYTDTGVYFVNLMVTDADGCTDTQLLATPIIISKPVPAFAAVSTRICPGAPLQFNDSSISRYPLSYRWDFGDGNSSILQNPIHTYAGSDSIYSVKLVITDSLGCTDSVTRLSYITARRPKPAFDIQDTTSICPPLETKFTFRGSDYESFLWYFGDSSTSTLANPNHFYNNYGNFIPKLYVFGYGGCIDSASAQVNVYDPLITTSLIYGPTTACNSLMVDYTLTTPPSTKFIFYPGDGTVDTTQRKTFQHFYPTFGYYSPLIQLTDSLQCLVYIGGPSQIRILGAEPLFGMDKKAFCDTGTVLFANFTIGNDPVVSSVWDFGDGNGSTDPDPVHTYSTPGTYYPSLTVNTLTGCSKTLVDTLRVYATPSPIITADTVVCINDVLLLQGGLALADTSIAWNWTFGNGATSVAQNPSTSYSTSGRFTITLDAANNFGCRASTTATVFVPPTPVVTVLNNPVIPVGSSVSLPVTYSPNIATYNWTPTKWLDCTDCPTPIATPKSTIKYKVDVTDIYGCRGSNDVTITVVCNDKNYFVPNTFTPNNDGVNDVFYPRGSGLTRVQSMRIFNRWGQMVYERKNFTANDATVGWNGTFNGKTAESDAYVYIIEFVCDNSVIIPFKGNVTLIR